MSEKTRFADLIKPKIAALPVGRLDCVNLYSHKLFVLISITNQYPK